MDELKAFVERWRVDYDVAYRGGAEDFGLTMFYELEELVARLESQPHSEPITKENLATIQPGDILTVPLRVSKRFIVDGSLVELDLDSGAVLLPGLAKDLALLLTCELRRQVKP
jgi:hypothetical protein